MLRRPYARRVRLTLRKTQPYSGYEHVSLVSTLCVGTVYVPLSGGITVNPGSYSEPVP
jgi:hypothetical protein